jgi:hypothetical protein
MWQVDNEQAKRQATLGSLVPYTVCVVEVCGYTFIFHSMMQIDLCIDYYSHATQPSNRSEERICNPDGWEPQRWHEKVPLYLLEHSKRKVVVVALETALDEYKKYPEAHTGKLKPDLCRSNDNHRNSGVRIGWSLRTVIH